MWKAMPERGSHFGSQRIQTPADLPRRARTDLSPSTIAAAWPEESRSPAIARFLRAATETAASWPRAHDCP
jgi:hypothetical protein